VFLFIDCKFFELSKFLKENNYRSPNTRAKFIIEARKFKDNIKNLITKFENENEAREFLVKNVKGIGYKEASHFMRNTGYKNFAILDMVLKNRKNSQIMTNFMQRNF